MSSQNTTVDKAPLAHRELARDLCYALRDAQPLDTGSGDAAARNLILEAFAKVAAAASMDGGGAAGTRGDKAADAFVSVANGLCDAIEDKDWHAVYTVWRNIADVLIGHRADLSEGLKQVPNYGEESDFAPIGVQAGGAGGMSAEECLAEVRERLLNHSEAEHAHLIAVDLPELISLVIGPRPQPASPVRPHIGDPDLGDLPF